MGKRSKVALLVGAGILLFGAAAVLEDRLGPIDPTSPGWRALVLNDTNRSVYVRSKGTGYNPLVSPGRTDMFYAPDPGQLDLVLVVTDEEDQTVRCIPVALDKRKDVTISVSSVGPCQ